MAGRVFCLGLTLSLFLTICLSGLALGQITITHTPYYEYVPDPINPYEIRATITSSAGAIIVTRIWYTTGTTWQQVFMQPTAAPNEYAGFIPAKPVGSRIIYYIRAGDDQGNILNDPPNAPGAGLTGHLFRIGHYIKIFSEDFETGGSGWISGMVTGEDDWMIGPPNLGGQNPNDPLTAFSGSYVCGNDLMGTTPQEGDYSPNVNNYIDSPTFDCTGKIGVRLFYRRWLTVEQGIYDTAKIYVNGNEVWANPSNVHQLDTEWVPEDVYLTPHADNNPAVVLRFELTSDVALQFGGWNFDDAKVVSWAPLLAMTVSNTTPTLGELFTLTVSGADPTSPWYLLAAKRQGQGFFQVPNGGPLVWTGLHANSQRLYFSNLTDSSGQGTLQKTIPNRPDIIGKSRRLAVVSPVSADYVVSPSVLVTFQ